MSTNTWFLILLVSPIVGAFACVAFSPALGLRLARAISLVPLLALIAVANRLNPAILPPDLLVDWIWLPGIPVSFALGLSWLAVPFLFLGLMTVSIAIWQERTPGVWMTSPGLLTLQAVLVVLFTAQDLIVFSAAMETFFLGLFFLARCDSANRSRSRHAVGFSLVAGAFLLGAAVILGAMHQAQFLTFSVRWSALRELSFPEVEFLGDLSPGRVIFWLLAISTFLRAPLPPAHGWFRHLIESGSGPVRIVSMGSATAIAVFTWVHWIIPILPEAYSYDCPTLMGVAAGALVYVSTLATLTTRLERWLAFWVCAQNSLALLAVFSFSAEATGAAVVIALLGPLALLGMAACLQNLDRHLATTDAFDIGSLVKVVPRTAWVVAGFLAAMIALPGTGAFAALLPLFAALTPHPSAFVAASVAWLFLVISAARIAQPLFSGASPHEATRALPDLAPWKFIAALLLLAGIVALGVRPDWLRSRTEPVLELNWKARLKAQFALPIEGHT